MIECEANAVANSRLQLPPPFVERLEQILPAQHFESVLASFSLEKKFSFRLNPLVGLVDETRAEIEQLGINLEPVNWYQDDQGIPLAFIADRIWRERLTHSVLIEQGRVYLQNLSSLLAPVLLAPQPGETVLDLAAAPGGKTTQIAQLMHNSGQLSAVEAVRNRMFKLQANLKRMGVNNCKTYLTDGRTVGQKTPARFDRVLLDAPCSSESRFRCDDPKSWETWSPRKIRETSRKQIGLLKAAIHAAKIGATIVYCTCSFAPEENEQVVDKVLKKLGDRVSIEPIGWTVPDKQPPPSFQPGLTAWKGTEFHPQLKHSLRVLPNQIFDAFYLVKIIKLDSTTR